MCNQGQVNELVEVPALTDPGVEPGSRKSRLSDPSVRRSRRAGSGPWRPYAAGLGRDGPWSLRKPLSGDACIFVDGKIARVLRRPVERSTRYRQDS